MSTPPPGLQQAIHSPPMSDQLVRVENLKSLMRARLWKPADLARALLRKPQQVNAWLSGTRGIGEQLARDIEERLGLARYALDDRGTPDAGGDQALRASPKSATLLERIHQLKEVPVLQWNDVDALLGVENSALKNKAPHLESYAVCSSKAKFVCMPDDSMAPEINAGDHILFDPTEVPRAGEVVLVRVPGVPSPEYFVRRYRPKTATVFEAAADNPAHLPLSSAIDDAEVVGVLIEHRRYRRPA